MLAQLNPHLLKRTVPARTTTCLHTLLAILRAASIPR
jgi:hypothetical protein